MVRDTVEDLPSLAQAAENKVKVIVAWDLFPSPRMVGEAAAAMEPIVAAQEAALDHKDKIVTICPIPLEAISTVTPQSAALLTWDPASMRNAAACCDPSRTDSSSCELAPSAEQVID